MTDHLAMPGVRDFDDLISMAEGTMATTPKLTPTHVANPVQITAYEIVSAMHRSDGSYLLRIAPPAGSAADAADQYVPIDATLAVRHTPAPGDFYVVADNMYPYINPRNVFLHKYRPIEPLDTLRAEDLKQLEWPDDDDDYDAEPHEIDPEDETRYGARP